MITYPLNNILYSAEDAELFHCTRTSGVFSADDEFAASVTGADNTVTIGPGIAWIRNARFSGKVAANKTSVSLDMGLADGSYPRIDAVVIQFDANANQTAIVVKQGVAASSPVPPEVVRTEAVYELHLYHVRRAAGAAVVSAADITDIRQDRNYCGVMMDDVTNIDENKFLAKTAYDPTGTVEAAGGISAYIAENAPKTTVVDSVTSTSKTSAASAASVKKAYDLANNAIPKSQRGAANGVATLGSNSMVPNSQICMAGDFDLTTSEDGLILTKQYAKYVKVGRLVFFRCYYTLSYSGSAGGETVFNASGLPGGDAAANDTGAPVNRSYYKSDDRAWVTDFGRLNANTNTVSVTAMFGRNTTTFTTWGCYISAS